MHFRLLIFHDFQHVLTVLGLIWNPHCWLYDKCYLCFFIIIIMFCLGIFEFFVFNLFFGFVFVYGFFFWSNPYLLFSLRSNQGFFRSTQSNLPNQVKIKSNGKALVWLEFFSLKGFLV